MRLWTLHPRHLDPRGLVAAWREALLAQKVLAGKTRGYRHHPQLARFRAQPDPPGAIAAFLAGLAAEARNRGYHFNTTKIARRKSTTKIPETRGQLLYEWKHLRAKLRLRDPHWFRQFQKVHSPKPHPLFRLVPGGVRDWEKTGEPEYFKRRTKSSQPVGDDVRSPFPATSGSVGLTSSPTKKYPGESPERAKKISPG